MGPGGGERSWPADPGPPISCPEKITVPTIYPTLSILGFQIHRKFISQSESWRPSSDDYKMCSYGHRTSGILSSPECREERALQPESPAVSHMGGALGMKKLLCLSASLKLGKIKQVEWLTTRLCLQAYFPYRMLFPTCWRYYLNVR